MCFGLLEVIVWAGLICLCFGAVDGPEPEQRGGCLGAPVDCRPMSWNVYVSVHFLMAQANYGCVAGELVQDERVLNYARKFGVAGFVCLAGYVKRSRPLLRV